MRSGEFAFETDADDVRPSRDDLAATASVAGGIQLAIETTGRSGSLAVLRGGEPLHTRAMTAGRRTAATLAPELEATLRWCSDHAEPPGYVSVAIGPGSFTGLRIGVTTAKTLAYAMQIPLVAVDSLAAIAATVVSDHDDVGRVLIGLSAYRGQVFGGRFDFGGKGDFDDTSRVFDEAAWRACCESARDDTSVGFAGDPAVFDPIDYARLRERTSVDAVGVGKLAHVAASRGEWSDPIAISPRYLRPSAAEEKSTSEAG